jgi:transposase InsO family protein
MKPDWQSFSFRGVQMMMRSVEDSEQFSAKRSVRNNDSWVIDIVVPDAQRIRHLVVLDAGTTSALLYEPIQNSGPAQVGEILESAFKRLGPPAQIVTDKSVEFCHDSFRSLLAAYGVQHVITSFAERTSFADRRFQSAILRLVRSKSKGKNT